MASAAFALPVHLLTLPLPDRVVPTLSAGHGLYTSPPGPLLPLPCLTCFTCTVLFLLHGLPHFGPWPTFVGRIPGFSTSAPSSGLLAIPLLTQWSPEPLNKPILPRLQDAVTCLLSLFWLSLFWLVGPRPLRHTVPEFETTHGISASWTWVPHLSRFASLPHTQYRN